MFYDQKVWIGQAEGEKVCILPRMANRHGLIAGATGTGKTTTLKVLAESFSDAGVPVFVADVKGDLSGLCREGTDSPDMQQRIADFGLADCGFQYRRYPVAFWDVFGQTGIPLRTTISEMGPLLLGKLLGLNPTQTDILTIVFKIADDEGLLLIDTKDLKSMLQYVAENNAQYSGEYGNIAKASINAILRGVVALESKGGEQFFTEPALNIADWFQTEMGQGVVNILDCRSLMNDASLYTTFLLWMLSELFEVLPEVGDPEKPRMVFFFDEAHLLFKGVSKVLLEKIEQVVKLIRSKGVSIFFITQNPRDMPDGVLSQLGNKIQHALRAYTPADEKAVNAAAKSFRVNPAFDTKEALQNLGTGEALISVLDGQGIPTVVQKCRILPPQSRFGAISEEERKQLYLMNNLYLRYQNPVDPDSAYEFLTRRSEQLAQEAKEEQRRLADEKAAEKQRLAEEKAAQRQAEQKAKAAQKEKERQARAVRSSVRSVGNSVVGTVGREVGKSLGGSIGGSFGKKLGGNLGASLGRSILGTFLKR